jgi:hypothetical protein
MKWAAQLVIAAAAAATMMAAAMDIAAPLPNAAIGSDAELNATQERKELDGLVAHPSRSSDGLTR